jgi:hypothetical protein
MTDTEVKVRCSAWAREVELSPIATIGCYRGFLLVESSLPWPKDIGEIPALSELAGRLGPAGVRLQALVPPSPEVGPAQHRVILHTRPADSAAAFSGYLRLETVAGDSLVAAADRLMEAAAAAASDLGQPAVDLLVCTHGRRDVCCGSQGTDLALQLAAMGMPPGVHLSRTSHTGGHRFAPTFLVLPQGTAWAFADVELVGRVLERSVPFAAVASHYRGCAGLTGPQVQALEREVLTCVGWDLLDRERTGYLTGETTGDGGQITRLDAGSDRWEAVVRPGRTLPVPDCMKPLAEAKKSETEWSVTDFRSVS